MGITAGTASIGFGASILVGAIAGVLMVFSVIGLERAGLDDPVGAISVHGTAGLWGVLAVGIFGDGTFVNQAIGAGAIIAWTFVTSFAVFLLVDKLVGIRVSAEEELSGLDRSEHGADSYPEFVFQELVAAPRDLDPVGSNGH